MSVDLQSDIINSNKERIGNLDSGEPSAAYTAGNTEDEEMDSGTGRARRVNVF